MSQMTLSLAPFRRLVAGLTLVLVSLSAVAAPERDPEQVIRDSIDGLMGQIDGRKEYYASNINELKSLVDDSLDDIADFRYIGASVMGRYFQNASPRQRSQFVDVFRQTLIDTYTKGLVTFDYRELRVLESRRASRHEDQASVAMEVVAMDGTVYPVSYTLRLSDGQWKVVNVIVNGINLGLTFRNQFDQAMRDHGRDYDAVIANWSPEIATEELEEGGRS
ncbi:ABC transporter substrate-binding protein [Halomonas sp. MCCC 1A17488]|uniref:ABC transporter substrate-binding protein n=1 Tax=Billgrantia sulfidoxydans TaxID=2733484 RepID=A0ABX7W5B3_9GAMM|nr:MULTISPECIES: ABC transporter substrate-binding protein [Halomonas]MCE8014619.1 ABC transporter substrate-binding protein [Halomonas sp. MCCC 1A17488]MCG3237952.1 ABC transporter substrate-binding protein [Halomonas sp. MCCC 1A17488]QPP48265.1 ABC transporter substrate-binding protein [Halomonas sp. SS10-MC5]QTP55566.1 ABC transporter substrate-binding protein [Halomonas sulfidoxydans]